LRVAFGPFTFDATARQLLCESRPVHISPKAFELLALLIEQRPAAVAKSTIHQRLWPDTFVSDGNLTVLMTELRHALADDAKQPLYMRTLHRFGYAFIGSTTDASTRVTTAAAAQCWLVSANDRAPLAIGDNVVGRGSVAQVRVGLDRAADLRVDPAGISRRHALVVVSDATVTVEDLSSKNGTFVDGLRVTGTIQIESGTEIRLGSVSFYFRCAADLSATQTQVISAGL
jgi:DNA-binding winged helix-turn-helix (wHTH) protein